MNSYNANSGRGEWLLVIRSNTEEYQEYELKPGSNNIGREADNAIILHDSTSSSYHADIHYDQTKNSVSIRDIESTNGTFVNGKRIQSVQALCHEDQIRVGLCLITIIQSDSNLPQLNNTSILKTKVTTELILESIDHYGVLLHNIGQQLVNVPDLDIALFEIAELIKNMLGAEECQVILADKFSDLEEMEIPVSIAKKTIENKAANLFLYNNTIPHENNDEATIPVPLLFPMLFVPVMIDDDVVALIFARKPLRFLNTFP